MIFTKNQKTAFRLLAMTKLIKRPMWIPEHMLGYCSRDKRNYTINVADDTGSDGVFWSVLIHELGHIYYNHMDIDIPKELKDVKNLCTSLGYNYPAIMVYYGGPMDFLNIAMDLEINTKLLEEDNIRVIKDELDTSIVTRSGYGIPEDAKFNTFRDYYEPLFKHAVEDNAEEDYEQLKQDIKEALKNSKGKLGTGLSDIPVNGNSIEIDDEEISDLLKNEDYKSGGSCEEGEEDTVGSELNSHNNGNKSIGKGSSSRNTEISDGSSSEDIKNFIKNIIDDKRSLEYNHDPLRHYNRGTRRNNSGLLYNSTRRRPSVLKRTRKLLVCVDISGSMDISDIKTAAQSLKEIFRDIHPDSKFVTCNCYIDEVYPICNIPDNIGTGGGTDMTAGIKYAIENGFTDIVIYSDFCTDLDSMSDLIEENNIKTYSIFVDSDSSCYCYNSMKNNTDWRRYEDLNKKVLVYKK